MSAGTSRRVIIKAKRSPTRTKSIVLFTTSTEQNGTALLRDNLAKHDPNRFVPIRSYREYVQFVRRNRHDEHVVVALSDTHLLVAGAVNHAMRVRWPILLTFYHYNQWADALEPALSRTRSEATRRYHARIPGCNVIAGSHAEAEIVRAHLEHPKGVHVVPAPVFENGPLPVIERSTSALSVVTVGRLVSFKTRSIVAMIEAMERLAGEGVVIEYSVVGDGPDSSVLRRRVAASPVRERIRLVPPVDSTEFSLSLAGHQVFYGMGGAVIRAAMVGMPAIVALADGDGDECQGLVSDHEHSTRPVFGGGDDSVATAALTDTLRYCWSLESADLQRLGSQCKRAVWPYSPSVSVPRFAEAALEARWFDVGVTIFDIARIRGETWLSRRRGVAGTAT